MLYNKCLKSHETCLKGHETLFRWYVHTQIKCIRTVQADFAVRVPQVELRGVPIKLIGTLRVTYEHSFR